MIMGTIVEEETCRAFNDKVYHSATCNDDLIKNDCGVIQDDFFHC